MKIFFEPQFSDYYRKFPIVLVDGGASEGMQKNWNAARKYLDYIGFEPDRREYDRLEKLNSDRVKYFNIGLYKEKNVLNLNLAKRQQLSSVLTVKDDFLREFPEAERFDVIKKVELEVDCLDNLYRSGQIGSGDFIKLEVQGVELEVLEGAKRFIDENIVGMELGLCFVSCYHDQTLFADADTFLRDNQFYLFDMQKVSWKRTVGTSLGKRKGQMILANVVYLKTIKGLREIVSREGKDEEWRKAKILKAITVALLYGYRDYAMQIVISFENCFSGEEIDVLKKGINSMGNLADLIPDFKGKNRIARFFKFFYELFRPKNKIWVYQDENIGNF